jgi:hypothetical protein
MLFLLSSGLGALLGMGTNLACAATTAAEQATARAAAGAAQNAAA